MSRKKDLGHSIAKFISSNFLGVAILASALVISGTLIYTSGPSVGKSTQTTQTGTTADESAQTQTGGRVQMDIGDAPVLGDANAPVTVIEFSDFSCPYCAMASGDNPDLLAYAKQNFGQSWEPIIPNLISNYVDTGKVKLAVKYAYGHSGGNAAQLVSWCLEDQGHYWDFYPLAYANQDDVEDQSKMVSLASTIDGVNVSTLQSCLDSGKYQARLDQELNEGRAAGVTGTPTFLIGNEKDGYLAVVGAQPFSQFETVVDSELSNAN